MIRNYQKNIGLFIILAVALTGIGYALDSDPAYPKLSTSLMEFTLLTIITFIILSLCYVGYRFIGETLFGSK
jgi:nitrate reductase NapE component